MRKIISFKNVEYNAGGRQILNGVSFKAEINDRLCFFGENGAGKSTILKILDEQLKPDAGSVTREGHIRTAHVSQEFDREYFDETIENYILKIAGTQFVKKTLEIAKKLGFNIKSNTSTYLCKNLSGGQQKILALSAAFSVKPDYLLLDEPENHIDIVSRKVLVSLLIEFDGGIVFVSHDRLIIDSIATKIIEIEDGKIHVSEGDYDDYIRTKMERLGGLQRQYDTELKRIRQLTQALVVLQQKAVRGKDVSQYRKRKEELESIKNLHKNIARPGVKATRIKIQQMENGIHTGKLLIKVKSGSFKYTDTEYLFKNVNLEIRSGSKIVLLGRNGTGKSTFLKCLIKEKKLGEGDVVSTTGVKIGYFDQHAEFPMTKSALDIVSKTLNLDDFTSRKALGAMKFDEIRMKTSSKYLSGGERMRLRFALAFGSEPDLLILDEPTNHIDEVTWEILLEACKNSKSTIVLTSHDYEFIENFDPNIFWMIKNDSISERHKDLESLLKEMEV